MEENKRGSNGRGETWIRGTQDKYHIAHFAKTEFDRVARKAQKKKEKVKTRLLKIKDKAQGVKA